jgi:hypothetical protein
MNRALAWLAMALLATPAVAAPRRDGPGTCPTGTKLVELARRAFSAVPDLKGAKIKPQDLVCRGMRARVPTWLLTFADPGCGGLGAGAAAIIQNGVVTWSEPGFYAPGTPCRGGTWQPADLDGDGNDELLWFQDYEGHEGSGSRSLTVMALVNGKPAESGELALESRGSSEGNGHNSYECSASYRLVPAPHGAQRIELVGHGHAPDDRCPKDGRHVYAWTGGKLIEP